jgi:hypothetical protein
LRILYETAERRNEATQAFELRLMELSVEREGAEHRSKQ